MLACFSWTIAATFDIQLKKIFFFILKWTCGSIISWFTNSPTKWKIHGFIPGQTNPFGVVSGMESNLQKCKEKKTSAK